VFEHLAFICYKVTVTLDILKSQYDIEIIVFKQIHKIILMHYLEILRNWVLGLAQYLNIFCLLKIK
jgi:hypothetical protein